MSSDMTIIGGPTLRLRQLRLVTFVYVPFSPPLLLILAFQPILFHTIVTEGHYYAVFYTRVFLKESRAELFDFGVANDMSKVTHVCVHRVETIVLFC